MPEILRNDSLTIGTAAVSVSLPSPAGRRVEFSARNNSTGGQLITLVLSDTQGAVAGTGIVLSPGQSIRQSQDAGYHPVQAAINGIADAAGAVLGYYERVQV